MTPEQIAAMTAIASIIQQIGTWPIGALALVIIFGPWVMLFLSTRSMEKRHEAVVDMYKNNAKLVENYEQMSSEQADTIRLSTAATTELTTFLRTKTPCHQLIKIGKNQ